MEQLNQKIKTALQKKEYDILAAYKTTYEKILSDMKMNQEKYQTLDLTQFMDKKIVSLEKYLSFFRGECLALSNVNHELARQNKTLKAQLEQLQLDNHSGHTALVQIQSRYQCAQAELQRLRSQIEDIKRSSPSVSQESSPPPFCQRKFKRMSETEEKSSADTKQSAKGSPERAQSRFKSKITELSSESGRMGAELSADNPDCQSVIEQILINRDSPVRCRDILLCFVNG